MPNPYIDVLKAVLTEHTALQRQNKTLQRQNKHLQRQVSQLRDELFERTRNTIQREDRCRVLMERLMEWRRPAENDEELFAMCRAFIHEAELSDTDGSDERFSGSSGYPSP
jgi:protease II